MAHECGRLTQHSEARHPFLFLHAGLRRQRRERRQAQGWRLPRCYVVLRGEGRYLQVEFFRVLYDVEGAGQAMEAIKEPDLMPHEYAKMLREGKG